MNNLYKQALHFKRSYVLNCRCIKKKIVCHNLFIYKLIVLNTNKIIFNIEVVNGKYLLISIKYVDTQ